MSNLKSIIILPGRAQVTQVSHKGIVHIPIRIAGRFDQLAECLSRRLCVPTSISEHATSAPGQGTIVVCPPDVLHDLEKASSSGLPWVVAVDLGRHEILSRAEVLKLAAAVETEDYVNWVEARGRPPAIYGRKELATRIDASASTHPLYSGANYARLSRNGELPDLLADYLAAYADEDRIVL